MKILVINAGSSSLKYQLVDMQNENVMAKGIAERIGNEGANLKHSPKGMDKISIVEDMKSHTDAIKMVLDALIDKEYGVIDSMEDIYAVGHRVVHGGEKFSGSVIIDDEVMAAIKENIALAPLHNPANIMGIEACAQNMPNKKQVAVFDTAFHQTMPPRAYLYGIPYKYYNEYKIRRYGFHGTSHKYIASKVAKVLGKSAKELKTVVCHLGNGGSIAAIKHGVSIDTTMGLTPLEGVLMGTRCGDLDPSIVEHMMNIENKSVHEVMDVLNKESGILGLSGLSSDMRDIEAAVHKGNKRAEATYEMFKYRVLKYIGAYAAAMGGVDCIVFTAGIGENNPDMRVEILQKLEYMGVKIDPVVNYARDEIVKITTDDSSIQGYSIATNEELMIARDTAELVG